MTQYILVYVTTPQIDLARQLAREAISHKLAACANILPQMESLYEWEGQVQKDNECVLILKTTEAHFPELQKKILQMHSYDCPCIIALPIQAGHKAFLDWIDNTFKP